MKKQKVETLSQFFLMLSLFFNPFGFDAVQYTLMLWTGSLLKANLIMYFVAALFFGLYLYSRWYYKRSDK